MRSLAVLALALAIVGCGKPSGPHAGQVPANVQSFYKPRSAVWKVLIDTVRYDYLLNVEVADEKRGYFSTELIRDYQPGQRSKYRLSGKLTFDGKSQIVTLYRHLQIQVGEEWKTIASDLMLERRILADLQKKLENM